MKRIKNNGKLKFPNIIDPFRLYLFGCSFCLIAGSLLLYTFTDVKGKGLDFSDFSIGREAGRNLVLTRDLDYLDYEATEIKRSVRESLLVPVFVFKPDDEIEAVEKARGFHSYLLRRKVRGGSAEAVAGFDSAFGSIFHSGEIEFISRWLTEERPFAFLLRYMSDILSRGFYLLPDNFEQRYPKGLIETFKDEGRTGDSVLVSADDVVTRKNLRENFFRRAAADGIPYEQIHALFIVALAFLEENVFLHEYATRNRLEKLREEAEPVFRRIAGGTVLISRGSIVTEADMRKIRLLAIANRGTGRNSIAGLLLYLFMLYGLSYLLLRPPMIEDRMGRKQILLVTVLNTVYLITALLILRFSFLPDDLSSVVVFPSALVSMLLAVLVSYRAGVLNAAILSLLQLLLPNPSPESMAFVFFAGVIGTRVIRNVDKRFDLLKAAMLLALLQGGAAAVLTFLSGYPLRSLFLAGFTAAAGGLAWGILILALLPLVEHLMNASTKFRLMELSDLNAPILKRMLSLAPGTYNHSVSVAHLSETACREIGANSLLARVGAYYHDIGKIEQAEYFIENQTGYNRHDQLNPGLSSTIIRSHVKMGVEQAAQLGLPDEVKEIIAQHHGSGLIRIFYQRALEKAETGISPEDYSYNGSPPLSREAAVVMLADSVEAVSRLFKKPNIMTIEKSVTAVIREKMESGQLTESSISLKDLDNITSAFVKVLAGYFHSRIEYPSVEELRR